MSPRGIAQYTLQDTYNSVQLFKWNELDNVYFRDKKFSIEVTFGLHRGYLLCAMYKNELLRHISSVPR